jgi:hypothetical protein
MKQIQFNDLVNILDDMIHKEMTQIIKSRDLIRRYNSEKEALEIDRQKAMTTPEELGFEGNGVNCEVDE